jgi:hypothetical protein
LGAGRVLTRKSHLIVKNGICKEIQNGVGIIYKKSGQLFGLIAVMQLNMKGRFLTA